MKFDVYCDESHPDMLSTKNPEVNFMVIGSVWLNSDNREEFKKEIHALRDKHKVGPEFKWLKVSKSRIDFYKDLVKWFFDKGDDLCFRCIAVDSDKVNLKYHEQDQELGFYKFYYQLLNPWILESNKYSIFCDYKSNRRNDRLKVLQNCLSNSNPTANILSVQATRSRESVLIQLADVFTGIVSSELNQTSIAMSARDELIRHTQKLLRGKFKPTPKSEKKFNIFKIKLQGGN
ncbi:DUF3800 domain-containing protein [bacterium]|nr:DUF3800 domain-containing protein [bacterium]